MYISQEDQSLQRRKGVLSGIMTAVTESLVVLDRQGHVRAFNRQFAERLGADPEATLGASMWDITPPEVRTKRKRAFRRVLGEKLPLRQDDHRSGRDFDINYVPILDDTGEVEFVVFFARETTLERTTEFELKRHEKLFHDIVEDQTELICRFTPGGTLTFVNSAYARYFGLEREQLIGVNFLNILPEEDREKGLGHLASLTKENPTGYIEHRVTLENGEVRWHQWNNRALFNSSGRLVEFQAVGRDITERIKAEEQLIRVSQEKERYQKNLKAIFQAIPEAIVTLNAQLEVVEFNDAFQSLACVPANLEPNQSLKDLLHPDCPLVKLAGKTLESKEPAIEQQVRCSVCCEEDKCLALSCVPYVGDNGGLAGVVVITRDITRLRVLEEQLQDRHAFHHIIGRSRRMQQVYQLLDHLADLDSNVLITGESGTGKELAAEALHYGGARSSKPLVKVNCSALSENLLESELFGHVKGAFTGAVRDKVGRITKAEGGTIFLDEIGDIPPVVQLKLLRFLETKEFERVGDSTTIRADVRLVAATNVDLTEKTRLGEFREDLYYRLKVMVVHMPALREHPEDIPLLADHFVRGYARAFRKDLRGVSDEVLRLFLRHSWPGNVRELKHVIEHAGILSPGPLIESEHLPEDFLPSSPAGRGEEAPGAASPEERKIVEALKKTRWNKTRAAELLGMSRATLHRRLKGLKIK